MSKFISHWFGCTNGHGFELLLKSEDLENERKCPTCGQPLIRIITPVRIKLDGCSGDFPTAADKWEKQHREKMLQSQKKAASNGDLEIF